MSSTIPSLLAAVFVVGLGQAEAPGLTGVPGFTADSGTLVHFRKSDHRGKGMQCKSWHKPARPGRGKRGGGAATTGSHGTRNGTAAPTKSINGIAGSSSPNAGITRPGKGVAGSAQPNVGVIRER